MARLEQPARRKGRARRIAGSIVRIVTGVYVVTALLLWLFQARMIYQPTREIESTPDAAGLPYEDVTFTAADGVKLTGWFVPAARPRGVVLFFHGNGGNISHRIDTLAILRGLDLSTFIIDYRGYGRSEGRPSEKGTYLDAEAAWDYLVNTRGIEPGRIVLFGRSLGGVFATYLAKDRSPAAVIVESGLSSVHDLASELFPMMPIRLLSRFKYPTIEYLPQAGCPVLLMHSPDDEMIPYRHGQRLFAAAAEPKEFLELTGGHNEGYLLSGRTYTEGLDAFLRRCLDR